MGVLSASSNVVEINAGNFENATQGNSEGTVLSMNFYVYLSRVDIRLLSSQHLTATHIL